MLLADIFGSCCCVVIICFIVVHLSHAVAVALLIFRSINLANWPLAYIYNTSETIRFILFKALLREHCIYRTVQNDSMLHYLFRLNFLSIWSIRGPFPSGHVKIYMICWGCGNSNSNYLRWTLKKISNWEVQPDWNKLIKLQIAETGVNYLTGAQSPLGKLI